MAHRILSVDDSDIAQEYIRAALSDIGYEDVVSFLSSNEALEALSAGTARADLILLDVMMPEIDGVELCARIRALTDWADTPIIMLTSRTDMDTLQHAFMAGANDYVTKPFNRVELQARMRSCLRLKSEMDRRRASAGRRGGGDGAAIAELAEVLGNKAGYQAALLAIPPAAHHRLGQIVLRINGLSETADHPSGDLPTIYRSVAGLLGAVPVPARALFCHWEGDLFCLAMPDSTEQDMRTTAQGFIDAVAGASLSIREGWTRLPLSLSAVLLPPGGRTPGEVLVRGIQMAERLVGDTEARIHVVHDAVGAR
ncbi:response regulator [Pseudooceanicola batsensis]|nr:response regulator [Pseudooceanicola batsensis]